MAKILHVEDDPEWQDWVREALEEQGYEVDSFSTLADAKTAAESGEYTVFVCDGSIGMDSGAYWANQLQREGHAAIILSRIKPLFTAPAFVNKKTWVRGGREELVALVNRMVAR